MNIHENCDFHAFSCYYIEDQENKMSINFAFSNSDAFQLRAYMPVSFMLGVKTYLGLQLFLLPS